MPEESSHPGRSIAVVAGAVLIVALGLFFFLYDHSAPSPYSMPQTNVPQEPVTPEQNEAVLQAAATTTVSSQADAQPAMPSANEQILENAQSQGEASAPPAPSPQDEDAKMKLLQSYNQ